MAYAIHVNGRTYTYETLDLARKVAAEVFERTGIVLGIEDTLSAYHKRVEANPNASYYVNYYVN